MLVTIAPSLNIYQPLTYAYTGDPGHIHVGMRVIVPVANRLVPGWILSLDSSSAYTGRVKHIVGIVHDDYAPSLPMMEYCRAIADLYFVSTAILLDYSLSPKRKPVKGLCFLHDGNEKVLSSMPVKNVLALTKSAPLRLFYKFKKEQSLGYRPPMEDSMVLAAERDKKDGQDAFLLSYRRETVYHELIDNTIENGKSVLIAVPDNLSAAYLASVIPGATVFNSSVTLAQREKHWNNFQEGKPGVVIGGLSAVLLPITNLGAVIVDRACAPMYRKTAFSDFHVHTLAKLRARSLDVPLLEGASTLTVEAASHREKITVQDQRSKDLPELDVHMLKPGERRIPESLVESVLACYENQEKALLILNRKTSLQFLFCPKCKKLVKCPHCRGDLKVDDNFYITCLSCGFSKKEAKLCSVCNSEFVYIYDISMASLKRQLEVRIPEQEILAITAENLDDPGSVVKEAGEKKIIISTPVTVNPFFRNLFDAIFYVRPESMFNINHFDAAEMIFSQVAEIKELVKHGGKVEIYSTFHFHYSLRLLQNEEAFFDHELKYREWFRLPPNFAVYHVEVRNKDLRALAREMRAILNEFKESLHIENPHLLSRARIHAFYRGKMEIHALPHILKASGLIENRNIKVELFAG